MALTDDDVRHVARLARLGVTDEEVVRFRRELERILDHVSSIASFDLTGVPVTSHPLDLVNVAVRDVPVPCLTLEDALLNAPDAADDGFRVPPMGT